MEIYLSILGMKVRIVEEKFLRTQLDQRTFSLIKKDYSRANLELFHEMELVATAGRVDNNIIIWDIISGDKLVTLRGHTTCVFTVCFSPCGRFLASGSGDTRVCIWSCRSWKLKRVLRGHTKPIRTVCFNRAGDKIVSTAEDNSVRVWNLLEKKEELKIEIGSFAACFNHSDDTIVVSRFSDLNIYDPHSGELIRTLSDSEEERTTALTIQCNSTGDTLVSGSFNGTLKLWDVATGARVQVFRGHRGRVTQASFNFDGTRIVSSSSYDKTARIWDVSSGECLLILVGHSYTISSCCFSEDGSKVITSCVDGSVKVWDSYTGEELRTLDGHMGSVESVAFRPSVQGSYI